MWTLRQPPRLSGISATSSNFLMRCILSGRYHPKWRLERSHNHLQMTMRVTQIAEPVSAHQLAAGYRVLADRAARRPTRCATSWTAKRMAMRCRILQHRSTSSSARPVQRGCLAVLSGPAASAVSVRYPRLARSCLAAQQPRPETAAKGSPALSSPSKCPRPIIAGGVMLARRAGMNTRLASNVHPRLISSSFPMLDVPG